QFRATHQVLLARCRDFGERDHSARHGAVVLHLPAARDFYLHRRGVLLHMLAAGDGHPHLGAAPCQSVAAVSPRLCWPEPTATFPALSRRPEPWYGRRRRTHRAIRRRRPMSPRVCWRRSLASKFVALSLNQASSVCWLACEEGNRDDASSSTATSTLSPSVTR